MTVWEMKWLVRRFVGRYTTPVLNLMFHSMEIMPGKTPFVRSEMQRRLYIGRLRRILAYLTRRGFTSRTLAEVYEEF
jgi:hypothetical protein